jgi:hypothetical protein
MVFRWNPGFREVKMWGLKENSIKGKKVSFSLFSIDELITTP